MSNYVLVFLKGGRAYSKAIINLIDYDTHKVVSRSSDEYTWVWEVRIIFICSSWCPRYFRYQ